MNRSASNPPAPEIQLRVLPQALRGSILAFDFSKRLHHDFVVQGPDLDRSSGGHCRRMRIDPNQGICLDQRGNAVGTLERKRTHPISLPWALSWPRIRCRRLIPGGTASLRRASTQSFSSRRHPRIRLRAGRVNSMKMTYEDAGLPGRPKIRDFTSLPKKRGLPGFDADLPENFLNTEFLEQRFSEIMIPPPTCLRK